MDIQLFMIYLKIFPSGHGLFLSGQHPLSFLQVLTSHLSLKTIRPILSSCVLIKGWFNPSPRVGNQPGCQVWLRDWQSRAMRFKPGNFAVNSAIKKETLSTGAAQLMDKPGASTGVLRSWKTTARFRWGQSPVMASDPFLLSLSHTWVQPSFCLHSYKNQLNLISF